MTVYQVLQENITILERLRIPATEEEIWRGVRAAIQNCRACMNAIEQSEAEAARKAAEEAVQAPDEPEEPETPEAEKEG